MDTSAVHCSLQWVTWWRFWSSWHILNQVDVKMCFPSELETLIGQSGENFTNRNLPYICMFVWMDTSGFLAYIRFWYIVDFKNLQYKNLMQLWNHKLVVLSYKWLYLYFNCNYEPFCFLINCQWVELIGKQSILSAVLSQLPHIAYIYVENYIYRIQI